MQRIALLYLLALTAIAASAQPPDVLWTRTYGDTAAQACLSMDTTSGGGFILAGTPSLSFLRTDSVGDTVWARTYQNTHGELIQSVRGLPDGGFIAAGYTNQLEAGGFLMRLNSAGDSLWRCFLDGTSEIYSVVAASFGGFIACGLALNRQDMVVVKTNDDGFFEWCRNYGGLYYDCGFGVRELPDGSFMAVG